MEAGATERIHVQTHQLHISKGRDRVLEIRSELFVFPEVLEVFVTGRPDVLVVVCSGRPRPAEWLRTLRAAGYETLARRRAGTSPLDTSESKSERNASCATSSSKPTEPPTRQVGRRSSSGLRAGLPEIALGQAGWTSRASSR